MQKRIVGIWGHLTCGRSATNLGGVLILGMYRHIGTTSLSRLRLRSAENNVVLPETLCGETAVSDLQPQIIVKYYHLLSAGVLKNINIYMKEIVNLLLLIVVLYSTGWEKHLATHHVLYAILLCSFVSSTFAQVFINQQFGFGSAFYFINNVINTFSLG